MKVLAVSKRQIFAVAALAFLAVAGSVSAFAVPIKQVARIFDGTSIKAQCCVIMGPTVSVTEPATVQPVIVTFNTDYIVDGTAVFKLSLNNGPCLPYGSIVAQQVVPGPGNNGPYNSSTFNWVVFPSDGLVQGTNTFTVCGGGAAAPVTVTLGFRTLAVQFSK